MESLRARWARLDRADRRIALPAFVLLVIGDVTLFADGPRWLYTGAFLAGAALMVVWCVRTLRQMRHWRQTAERMIAELEAGRSPGKDRGGD